MDVNGVHYRTIWLEDDGWSVRIIDQTLLPHEFSTTLLTTLEETCSAIETMQVRGAPLIGVTAAYGLALALRSNSSDAAMQQAIDRLTATRPTAVNLQWALERVRNAVENLQGEERVSAAYAKAAGLADEDVSACSRIGRHGAELIYEVAGGKRNQPVQILTHCNAGWLATVDWGTALAPVYRAHDAGIPVHVWVDETRPRYQGASLTMWELMAHGVPCTLVADNVGGHLMQRGMVDLCLVGTDRTTRRGDVANKIGTYLKALAARDNGVPFYVAAPASSIDWSLDDGVTGIEIEQRSPDEVTRVIGCCDGRIQAVDIAPAGAKAANFAFDVTPACLVTALVTDRGVCPASREGLISRFPERA